MERVRSKALQGKILTAKDIICVIEKKLKKKGCVIKCMMG